MREGETVKTLLIAALSIVAAWAAACLGLLVVAADASLKTTVCTDLGGSFDAVDHTVFVCSPGWPTDSLSLALTPEEILRGVVFLDVSAPPGITTTFSPLELGFSFPEIGPLECLPQGPGGAANRIHIELSSPDSSALVVETWTRNGVGLAALMGLLMCPPGTTGLDAVSWGRVRSLYR